MSRLSWRTKLLALFTLVLGALLLFQLFYIIPNFQDREVEMTIAKQEEISYHIAREVDIDLFRIEDRLKRIAKLPEFYNMDIDNQHSIMVQHEDISLLISSLFVLDDKGWFICGNLDNISVYTTCSYADKPYFFVPFEQDEIYFGPPQFYSRSELMATSISVPIKSVTGERIGVLLAGMRLNEIIENIANYPLDNETIAYLVDREGTVIAHSKIDVFSLEKGPLTLVGCNSSLVQAIMKGEKSGFDEHYHDNVAYYGAFSTLESNGWGVVVGTPKHVVLAKSNEITRWMLLISILIFVITFAITMVFSRQIMLEQKLVHEKLLVLLMKSSQNT